MNKRPISPGKRKTSYHHGDLAEALTWAGREILNENGAEKLSLRGVAARVGVSQAAPYSHFSDKKELLRAISATGFQELTAKMEACRTDNHKSSSEHIIDYGIAYIEFALANPNIYQLMFSEKEPDSDNMKTGKGKASEASMTVEAKKSYAFLLNEYESICADSEQASALALGAWSMVHGLAALIGTGLVELPKTGRREALRGILLNQSRIPD